MDNEGRMKRSKENEGRVKGEEKKGRKSEKDGGKRKEE